MYTIRGEKHTIKWTSPKDDITEDGAAWVNVRFTHEKFLEMKEELTNFKRNWAEGTEKQIAYAEDLIKKYIVRSYFSGAGWRDAQEGALARMKKVKRLYGDLDREAMKDRMRWHETDYIVMTSTSAKEIIDHFRRH